MTGSILLQYCNGKSTKVRYIGLFCLGIQNFSDFAVVEIAHAAVEFKLSYSDKFSA